MSYFSSSFFASPYSPSYTYPHPHRLKVQGEGVINAQPDLAEVILGVTTENIELKLAQEKNAEEISSILNTLKSMGILSKDIATQSYTINPQYDYVDGKQIFRGYQVVHTLKVTIRNLDQIGEIIDASVESGANVVHGITFSISNPSKLYQQALTLAIEDALMKAITVTNKMKVQLSPIPIEIVEENKNQFASFESKLLQVAESTTPIQSGQISIYARIEAIFIYSSPYN